MTKDTNAVTIPRKTLELALLEHLTSKVFENPEERDALIRDLIRNILQNKEHDHDKETVIQKYIRIGVQEEVKKIAAHWCTTHRKEIVEAVGNAMKNNLVEALVTASADGIAERLKRGYY